MRATQSLHDLGQSLWLDNITRDILNNGTLQRYIDEFSVTGLTSNPTIFEHAISKSASYDGDIAGFNERGIHDEALFFELALQDLRRAADLFLPVHTRTNGVDGFVSLEVSPDWHTTPKPRLPRLKICMPKLIGRICSSKFRELRKEILLLKSRSSRAFPSM